MQAMFGAARIRPPIFNIVSLLSAVFIKWLTRQEDLNGNYVGSLLGVNTCKWLRS